MAARDTVDPPPWAEWEDDVIVLAYSVRRPDLARYKLVHRSSQAIRKRAWRLGLKANEWDPLEDKILHRWYYRHGAVGCQKILTYRSLASIYARAKRLELTTVVTGKIIESVGDLNLAWEIAYNKPWVREQLNNDWRPL